MLAVAYHLLALEGCRQDTTLAPSPSNPPAGSAVPAFQVRPDSIDFGLVDPMGVSSGFVAIESIGDAPLVIGSVGVEGSRGRGGTSPSSAWTRWNRAWPWS